MGRVRVGVRFWVGVRVRIRARSRVRVTARASARARARAKAPAWSVELCFGAGAGVAAGGRSRGTWEPFRDQHWAGLGKKRERGGTAQVTNMRSGACVLL